MAGPSSVDAYLATLAAEQRAALEHVRRAVARLAPAAVETISYGIPTFKLRGKGLIWYAGWKAHCSIYPLTGTFLADHTDELAAFRRTKGSIHFTPAAPIPAALLEALIRARIADLQADASSGDDVGGGVRP